jgi:hypothetical protein
MRYDADLMPFAVSPMILVLMRSNLYTAIAKREKLLTLSQQEF